MEFYQVREKATRNGTEVYADFRVRQSRDLMIRGGAFYAIWDERAGLWSTDEYRVQQIIDDDLYRRAEELTASGTDSVTVRALDSFGSNGWALFRRFIACIPDNFRSLDDALTFLDTPPKLSRYASKRLPYAIEEGEAPSYHHLLSVLYAPEERQKLEWAVGSILAGDARHIQKFFVLFGEGGTGKSTFLNLLQMLFEGYWTVFDAKAITVSANQFSTEVFKSNPLVAIQHDGDLSKIEDNTKLNSVVSHEKMTMNEKYRSTYSSQVNAMLFIGTNQAVRITDAKSGLIRRLIDVHPTGNIVPVDEYISLTEKLKFELGAIAAHCLAVYRKLGKNFYSSYRPLDMMVRTDVFFNFLLSSYEMLREQDGITLRQAWALYKTYTDEAGFDYRMNMHRFRDELRNYFVNFEERAYIDGAQVRSWYFGLKKEKFLETNHRQVLPTVSKALSVCQDISLLDDLLKNMPAQYSTEDGIPTKKWTNVKTTLAELDTSKLHFVRPPENHIVIDFDLRDERGEKSLERSLEAASHWPPTYAELSKSGSGIHLHYLYDGDVSRLSAVYDEGIEVKVFSGASSLRRKLTLCNDIPVAVISSGLPLKEKRVLDADTIKSERGLRIMILRNLGKEFHAGTKPSIDFIWKILEDAYNSGLSYDVTDLRGRILAFANNSTNHSEYCVRTVLSMKFASDSVPAPVVTKSVDDRPVFYDVEVYPNLFVVCWKYRGDANVVRMINPSPAAIEALTRMKLVGFNNRQYDNHILYARIMGYTEGDLFRLSQKIISGEKSAFFGDAYNLSYADIYDFSSVKQSLKKFQLELGLNHLELGLPWDQPVDPARWEEVADYCANDVTTTEQVFEARAQDFAAREVLAKLSGLTVNDTTQRHTAKIIFGDDRNPQGKFVYTDLSEQFPGYKYELGKSTYRGEETGEGGYVYAEPGMYTNVAVLDVASMHPTSIEVLNVFGDYTRRFSELKSARIAVKRRAYNEAKNLLGGALGPYLGTDEGAQALSYALKIIINIVYGLTSASFPNPFRDPRNKDNIVAKRGALFMIDLKHAVQERGFQVVHIKTDSIKIPDATPEIIDFVMKFGEKYGYEFEHETTYEKFCLVNDAVYIAKADGKWTATGAQFAHPYVFKTLFSKEPLTFDDFIEIKTVTTALHLKFGDAEPQFVGRAGAFVPVIPESGGGVLLRSKDGVFHAATGTKGYLWKEADVVKSLNQDEFEGSVVDMRYFRKLADAAKDSVSKFGDFEWFAS